MLQLGDLGIEHPPDFSHPGFPHRAGPLQSSFGLLLQPSSITYNPTCEDSSLIPDNYNHPRLRFLSNRLLSPCVHGAEPHPLRNKKCQNTSTRACTIAEA